MTIAEVLLAEKGYSAKKEFEANLMLMAARNAQAKKPKLFDFASKPKKNQIKAGVNQSTIEERNKVFDVIDKM